MKRAHLLVITGCVVALAWAPTAGAATITVGTTGDDFASNGNCTLREAIQAANHDAAIDACTAGSGADLVQLGSGSYAIALSSTAEDSNQAGDFDIQGPVTIQGAGAGSTTIDAAGDDRALDFTAAAGPSTVRDLTIAHGRARRALGRDGADGGAIQSHADLTVSGVSFVDDRAGDGTAGSTQILVPGANGGQGGDGGSGGAIWSDHVLTLSGSTFSDVHAGSGGGGGRGTAGTNGGTGHGGSGGNGGAGGAGGDGGAIVARTAAPITDTSFEHVSAGSGGAGGAGGARGPGSPPGNPGAGGDGGRGGWGGAIDLESGTLLVRGSTIADAAAGDGGVGGVGGAPLDPPTGAAGVSGHGGQGGAIEAGAATNASIENSSITASHAGDGGDGQDNQNGGIRGSGGNGGPGGAINAAGLTVRTSTIAGNRAGMGGDAGSVGSNETGFPGSSGVGGSGGGIRAASTSLSDSTLAGNAAGDGGRGGNSADSAASVGGHGGDGGGLAGPGTLSNATLHANHAGAGGDGGSAHGAGADPGHGADGGSGGGVYSGTGDLTLSHATVVDGSPGDGGDVGAPGFPNGGGSGLDGDGGGVTAIGTISDSIVAGNDGEQCSGQVAAHGNLSFPDASCGGVTADPKLSPLGANGGPTPTAVPRAGSAALDVLLPGNQDCPGHDQRGVARPQGPGCDIGAVEAAATSLVADPSPVDFGGPAAGAAVRRTVTLSAPVDSVQIGTASLTGSDANDFAILADHCSGASLRHGENCTLDLLLASTGAPRSAVVHVTHNGAGPALDVPLTAAAFTPAGPGGQGGGGTAVDATPPLLDALALTNRRFAVGRAPTATAARSRVPTGTVIRFRLSEASTVTIAVQQKLAGRRKGGRCVKPSRKLRKAKKCTRTVTAGTLTRHGVAGSNSVAFSGRIGRKALKPGKYRALLKATDAAGNSSSPRTVTFQIVKR